MGGKAFGYKKNTICLGSVEFVLFGYKLLNIGKELFHINLFGQKGWNVNYVENLGRKCHFWKVQYNESNFAIINLP